MKDLWQVMRKQLFPPENDDFAGTVEHQKTLHHENREKKHDQIEDFLRKFSPTFPQDFPHMAI